MCYYPIADDDERLSQGMSDVTIPATVTSLPGGFSVFCDAPEPSDNEFEPDENQENIAPLTAIKPLVAAGKGVIGGGAPARVVLRTLPVPCSVTYVVVSCLYITYILCVVV